MNDAIDCHVINWLNRCKNGEVPSRLNTMEGILAIIFNECSELVRRDHVAPWHEADMRRLFGLKGKYNLQAVVDRCAQKAKKTHQQLSSNPNIK